jgi:hypothetical protein
MKKIRLYQNTALSLGTSSELSKVNCISKDLCVLEVKSSSRLIDSYVLFLLNKYRMKKEAVSKYALGVQAQKINMDGNYGIY